MTAAPLMLIIDVLSAHADIDYCSDDII